MLNSILKIWLDSSTYTTLLPTFRAFRQPRLTSDLYLTGLVGWYEEANLTFDTQPKLLGNGSFITGVSNDNKTITLTLTSNHENELALRNYVQVLRQHILSQITSIKTSTLEIEFYNTGGYTTVARKEVIEAHMTAITDLTEHSNGKDLIFTIEFLAVNPIITITTP